MSEPYLILHKVRGEPAFDIAERMEVEGYEEPWWIIPTSGHRAYPYWHNLLDEFGVDLSYPGEPEFLTLGAMITKMPPDWPDHYEASASRSRLATAASDILSIMGLGNAKPQAPVKRRVIP